MRSLPSNSTRFTDLDLVTGYVRIWIRKHASTYTFKIYACHSAYNILEFFFF